MRNPDRNTTQKERPGNTTARSRPEHARGQPARERAGSDLPRDSRGPSTIKTAQTGSGGPDVAELERQQRLFD